jgi:hypothetical protein
MQPVLIDYHLSCRLAHILAVLGGEIITTSEATNIIIFSLPPRVLAENLRWAAPHDATLVGELWAGMSADDERELLTQGWSPDGDPGAVAIWRRAYQMEQVVNYVDSPRQEALRAWGFVCGTELG